MLWFSGLCQTGKQHNDDIMPWCMWWHIMPWFSGLCQTGKQHNDDTLCHGSQDFARQINSTMMTHAMILRILTGKQHNHDTLCHGSCGDTLCYGSQDFARQVIHIMPWFMWWHIMLWFSGLCQTDKQHNDDTLCHGSCGDTLCYGSQDIDRQVNSTVMTHYAVVLRTLPDR